MTGGGGWTKREDGDARAKDAAAAEAEGDEEDEEEDHNGRWVYRSAAAGESFPHMWY